MHGNDNRIYISPGGSGGMNSPRFTPISAPSTHACVVDYYSIDSSPLHHMISYSN